MLDHNEKGCLANSRQFAFAAGRLLREIVDAPGPGIAQALAQKFINDNPTWCGR